MSKDVINLEKNYKKYSKLFAIIIIILVVFLIIPDGMELPPLGIDFEASEEGVRATFNKPTGSEIAVFVILLIFITIWIYMRHKHKEKLKNKK